MIHMKQDNNHECFESNIVDIYLAGGCFWGVQAYLARINGVCSTQVGYANGLTENPTYEEVCNNNTGHAEVVYVRYDKTKISLTDLLKNLFKVIDPTTLNKQGGDIGRQYRSGIYYVDKDDKKTIVKFITEEQFKYNSPIVVEVLPLENYYVAEEYHQNYLQKNPNGYCHINL